MQLPMKEPAYLELLSKAALTFDTACGCWIGREALRHAKFMQTHLDIVHGNTHFIIERSRTEVRLYNPSEQEYWWPLGPEIDDINAEALRHE